jgi:PAS domain S-box-containing protein
MAGFEWLAATGSLMVGPGMRQIAGLTAEEARAPRPADLLNIVHPDDREAVTQALRETLSVGDRFDLQIRIVRPDDGRPKWLEIRGSVERGPDRKVSRVLGVARDISQQRLRENERETLVAELDHRVKNVLASVQSLAAQSARRTTSLEGFLKTFLGRVDAMAAAHTLLMATRWRGADIGNIAAAELGGLAHRQARWGGPDILLNPRATNALTLALHELGTNAVKFGALSIEGGRVDVRWHSRPEGGFELIWQESDGPRVTHPGRYGFGRTLLERVTGRELGGSATLEFHPQGVRATLIADASALAHPDPATEAESALAGPPALMDEQDGASEGEATVDDIRGVKVLIVEDAVLLALELEAGLTEAGAVVVGMAASLEEAQAMTHLDFDVAVLDANLNGQSVIPVAHALARRGAPFIFATGYGEAGAAPEGFGAPVVRKPYNVRQIATALVAALEQD